MQKQIQLEVELTNKTEYHRIVEKSEHSSVLSFLFVLLWCFVKQKKKRHSQDIGNIKT